MSSVHQLFKKLYSGEEEDRGFSETEISQAEERLGVRLPSDLRTFYLTQVRNKLINSCHDFARPEHLTIYKSEWLVFYGENQGIWACAFNLNEYQNGTAKIYIDYEQMGYEVEADSLYDFLIVRAVCDYSHYIYPYRMYADHAEEKDIKRIEQKLQKPRSDIHPKSYYRRRLYWKDENEVVGLLEYDPPIYNGKKGIIIVSMQEDAILRYQNELSHLNWNIDGCGETKTGNHLTSYLEKHDVAPEVQPPHPANDPKDYPDSDLPF